MESWPPTCAGTPARLFDPLTGKPALLPSQPVSGPSRDERLLAAFSHAGAWLMPVLLPLIYGWPSAGNPLTSARRPCRRWYSSSSCNCSAQPWLPACWPACCCPSFFLYSERTAVDPSSFGRIFLVGMLLGGLASGLQLLLLLYSGVAILRTWQGADFRYPLIGKWVK